VRTTHALLSLALQPALAVGQGTPRELRGELASVEDGEQNPRLLA
jgi:hypothetical protein